MPVPNHRRFPHERIVDADVRKGRWYRPSVPPVMLADEPRRRDADRSGETYLIRTDSLKKIRVGPPGQLYDRTGIAILKYQNRRCKTARTERRPIDLAISNEAATDHVLARPVPERLRNRTAPPPQLCLKRARQFGELSWIQADCRSVRFFPYVRR